MKLKKKILYKLSQSNQQNYNLYRNKFLCNFFILKSLFLFILTILTYKKTNNVINRMREIKNSQEYQRKKQEEEENNSTSFQNLNDKTIKNIENELLIYPKPELSLEQVKKMVKHNNYEKIYDLVQMPYSHDILSIKKSLKIVQHPIKNTLTESYSAHTAYRFFILSIISLGFGWAYALARVMKFPSLITEYSKQLTNNKIDKFPSFKQGNEINMLKAHFISSAQDIYIKKYIKQFIKKYFSLNVFDIFTIFVTEVFLFIESIPFPNVKHKLNKEDLQDFIHIKEKPMLH